MIFSGLFGAVGVAEGTWYAFWTSDMFGQGIVVVLLIISVITWTIMWDKWLELQKGQAMSLDFNKKSRSTRQLVTPELYNSATICGAPLQRVYISGARKLIEFYGTMPPDKLQPNSQIAPTRLTAAQREAVRTVMDNTVADQLLILEERVPYLALAVSGSPFIGLLGTVWGVMMAFVSAAMIGAADIKTLAPGISGALLTTVVGLLVAIPSLGGYNLITNKIRKTTVLLDNFVEEFMTRLALEQLDFETPNQPAPSAELAAQPAYEAAQVVMPLNSLLQARKPAAAEPPPKSEAPSNFSVNATPADANIYIQGSDDK